MSTAHRPPPGRTVQTPALILGGEGDDINFETLKPICESCECADYDIELGDKISFPAREDVVKSLVPYLSYRLGRDE